MDFSYNPAPGSEALIDNSRSHSGTNSVRISTSNVTAPHFIFQALPADLASIYVRAWVNPSATIGGGPKTAPHDHSHFIGTLANPSTDGNEIRLGPVQGNMFGGFLPSNGDAFTSSENTKSMPADTWSCVEWALIKDPTFDQLHGWINGEIAFSAIQASDWGNNPGGPFINNQTTAFISFGWRTFGSGPAITDIWFDDIAVSTEKIGCN